MKKCFTNATAVRDSSGSSQLSETQETVAHHTLFSNYNFKKFIYPVTPIKQQGNLA